MKARESMSVRACGRKRARENMRMFGGKLWWWGEKVSNVFFRADASLVCFQSFRVDGEALFQSTFAQFSGKVATAQLFLGP